MNTNNLATQQQSGAVMEGGPLPHADASNIGIESALPGLEELGIYPAESFKEESTLPALGNLGVGGEALPTAPNQQELAPQETPESLVPAQENTQTLEQQQQRELIEQKQEQIRERIAEMERQREEERSKIQVFMTQYLVIEETLDSQKKIMNFIKKHELLKLLPLSMAALITENYEKHNFVDYKIAEENLAEPLGDYGAQIEALHKHQENFSNQLLALPETNQQEVPRVSGDQLMTPEEASAFENSGEVIEDIGFEEVSSTLGNASEQVPEALGQGIGQGVEAVGEGVGQGVESLAEASQETAEVITKGTVEALGAVTEVVAEGLSKIA